MRNTSGGCIGCMMSQIRAQHRDVNVKFARCVAANAATTRRQGKMQSPRPCREASQRGGAGCALASDDGGGARPRTFRSSEASAWPPARAAGWKASPKGRRRHIKGCFSGHEPAGRGLG
eukprot:978711-Prymnesium_polylepis.1